MAYMGDQPDLPLLDGEKVRQLRQQRGLSQQKLGENVGISNTVISEVERATPKGKARPSRRSLVVAHSIARGLGVRLEDLLADGIPADDGARRPMKGGVEPRGDDDALEVRKVRV